MIYDDFIEWLGEGKYFNQVKDKVAQMTSKEAELIFHTFVKKNINNKSETVINTGEAIMKGYYLTKGIDIIN